MRQRFDAVPGQSFGVARRARPVLLGLTVLILAPAASAATPDSSDSAQRRVERPVASLAPDARKVDESFVRIYAPLPESAPPHPSSCDWVSYLRFRNPDGPRQAKRADSVLVAIPGFLGGAGSFDQVARNVVRNAAARDEDVEFWALDRRANCLEDDSGVRGQARAGDPRVAFDYYFGERKVRGKRFGGFVTPDDAAFLEDFGLERTLRDWYTVLKTEIPGRERRGRKVLCGGHSLGGPLTAAFASWDFDDDPDTKRDAGYKQCAGFFGLDTSLSIDGSTGGPGGVGLLVGLVAQSGASPYIDAPPLTPQTLQLPPIIGVAAYQQPGRESLINQLIPQTAEFELALRILFSRDAANFATGEPSIRDFRLTNEAILGGVFDDNSAGISIIRSSAGFILGGPLTDKNFPAPDPSLALPEKPHGPLYRWQNYDRVGRNGAPVADNDLGQPYTSRESETSSIGQLARAMFEAPANFIEQYFPTRIVTDVAAAQAGDRSGDLRHLRYDGVAKRPAALVQAGDSNTNAGSDNGGPEKGDPPNDKPLSREVTLPGYNHLDVVTAARRQNDGRPEGSSTTLERFACEVVGYCGQANDGPGEGGGGGFTRDSPPRR